MGNCICSQGNLVEIQTPATWPDRLHDRPASCVIGQQYSSAAFVSLRLHYRNENFSARLKNFTVPVLKRFINRVSLKLRNLKLCRAAECLYVISLFQTNSSSDSSFVKSYVSRRVSGSFCLSRRVADGLYRCEGLKPPSRKGKGKLYTSYVYDGGSGGV